MSENSESGGISRHAPCPPAADIPGAVARTEHALGELGDADRFEQIAVYCLDKFEPSLRPTGGPGDEQRDAVGGPLFADNDKLVMTASLEGRWAPKVERDLDGLAKHGHKPERVIAVTNRRTGANRRGELEKEAPEKRGYKLRIIDVKFLARRFLTEELRPVRQELLGLPPPQPPVAVDAATYAARQIDLGAPDTLLGREEDLDKLVRLLNDHVSVRVIGPGGIGKTRLVLEAAERLCADRVLFLDERVRLDADLLASELAGADRLVLVVDNAHRLGELAETVGLLGARTWPHRTGVDRAARLRHAPPAGDRGDGVWCARSRRGAHR